MIFLLKNNYVKVLFKTIFIIAYFGLFRVSEPTAGPHAVKVVDVHLGHNKNKALFILWSSKMHGKYAKPQMVKISSKKYGSERKNDNGFCPFKLLQIYAKLRPAYLAMDEPFFVFQDRKPVSTYNMRCVLRTLLKCGGFRPMAYGMQSRRAGRSCDLFHYGVSVETIKKLGRWTSNAVYTYLR